jgi:hypothetical protein
MALEPGGYSDKFGNRYEGRWTAKQLLRVLNEDLRSLTVESVSNADDGADLVVVLPSGARQAHQCKLRNLSKGSWSLADLNSRGVLAQLRRHLDANESHEFAFVSAIPSPILHDISTSARNSSGDPEEFVEKQIQLIGEDRRKAFAQFCEYLQLDPTTSHGRTLALSYLSRLFIENWPDTTSSRSDLNGFAQMLVSGSPSVVVALLADFAYERLRQTIDAQAVWQFLESRGHSPRRLVLDERVLPAARTLQDQFFGSIRPDLIAGEIIPRRESAKVLDALSDAGVVILHGAPGGGKTSVLFEVAQHLVNQNTAVLPVRLDRRVPRDTPKAFGATLGLPESPVLCLASLAGDRTGVLILDQLDALRWTSSHSLNALEVCRSLVDEVRQLRRIGKRISVVLACRTYDLRNDPEIQRWIRAANEADDEIVEIAVEPLTVEEVMAVFTEISPGARRPSDRQLKILASPQHLAMWASIEPERRPYEFQNRVQIMRAYWTSRLRELQRMGHAEPDVRSGLSAIVDYMDRQGTVAAPASIVQNQGLLDSLRAVGLLRTEVGQLSFSHQSYLDYLVATRVVSQLHTANDDILAWLGEPSSQTLFRREQLRQALCLLSEESPQLFHTTVERILNSCEVRFHLKHLSLEVLGLLEDPGDELQQMLLELANNPDWGEHIFGTVYLGNAPYVKWLIDKGHMEEWLNSDDKCSSALWICRTAPASTQDLVAELLLPFLDRGDKWPELVFRSLPWQVEDDSDAMFEMRLTLARRGIYREHISWDKIEHERVWRLLDAVVTSWTADDLPTDYIRGNPSSRREAFSNDDLQYLIAAIQKQPGIAWLSLIEHIRRLSPAFDEEGRRALELWLDGDRFQIRHGLESAPHALVSLCIEAGKCLAEVNGEQFWNETCLLRLDPSPILQFIFVEVYAILPESLADAAVEWVLDDLTRLTVGTGVHEVEWMPTARLFAVTSAHCSDAVFQRLEKTLVYYHSPDELRDAEYWLPSTRSGYFGDYWGRAQYFLLPALCQERCSVDTKGLIGVLTRKFDSYPQQRFISGSESRGGFVGSTISTESLNRISDKSWLAIVKNQNVSGRRGDWRRVLNGRIEESSVLQFSRQLATMAKQYPERFARLALSFTENVPSEYKAAILEALQETEGKDIPNSIKAEWTPASIASVEAVLANFGTDANETYASQYCWLMCHRADEAWSPASLEKLRDYATNHPVPKPGMLQIWPANVGPDPRLASIDSLEDNTLNSVRSVAAIAIGEQMWNNAAHLATFRETVLQICDDPHPTVLVGAARMCVPILNIDKDFAIACFERIASHDLRAAASRHGTYFFNSGMQSHHEQLARVVRQMIKDDRDDVATRGACEVAARWLFNDFFVPEVESCMTGRASLRKGLAQIAVHFVAKPEYIEKCQRIIRSLQDDEDKEVRQIIARVAHDASILAIPGGIKLMSSFIGSRAFQDDPDAILYALSEYSGDLVPFSGVLFSICDQLVGPLRDASRDPRTSVMNDVSQFVPILLRLYEQAEDAAHVEVASRCLDCLDAMFGQRIGVTREIAQLIG